MKAFITAAGLTFIVLSSAMAFQPPTIEETLSAIGSTDGLTTPLKRALKPDHDFEPIPIPHSGDWLAEHHESGQSFDEYVRLGANRPDNIRNIIYLQPLGQFKKDRSPSIELLREYAAAYFMMDVRILPARQIGGTNLTTRVNPYTQNRQILTTDILKLLKYALPENAFCILAVTMEDLYPDPRWNFVFGQASLRNRVGVFSFARYDPAFYGKSRGHLYRKLLLRRSIKVLAHETAHMFSLDHCIYFKCAMNGSNHLQESDSRPLSLCPVCLHKLQHSVGFDVATRYRHLLQFYRRIGLKYEVDWVSGRLKKIEGSNRARQ
jgi:archaemetzincin